MHSSPVAQQRTSFVHSSILQPGCFQLPELAHVQVAQTSPLSALESQPPAFACRGVVPLRVGAALAQSTQNDVLCVGGENGLRGRAISVAAASLGNAALANAPKQGGGLATLAMGPRVVDVHTLPGWPTRPERPNAITHMGMAHSLFLAGGADRSHNPQAWQGYTWVVPWKQHGFSGWRRGYSMACACGAVCTAWLDPPSLFPSPRNLQVQPALAATVCHTCRRDSTPQASRPPDGVDVKRLP
eukprot:364238-Chlamydomonas_euryale.AAC.8